MGLYFPVKKTSISAMIASVFVYLHWTVYGFYRWIPHFLATVVLSSVRLTTDLINGQKVDQTRRIADDISSAVCFYSDGFRFIRRTMLAIPEPDGATPKPKGPFDFQCSDLNDWVRIVSWFVAVNGGCAAFWIYVTWKIGLLGVVMR